MKKLGLFGLCCLFLWGSPVWGQENNQTPEAEGFRPHWYIGPVFRLDGIQTDTGLNNELDSFWGLQAYYQMSDYFGTGGSLLYLDQDSQMQADLFARWYWNLPLVQPYAGLQIGYFTRDNGGLSLALRPGIQIEAAQLPLMLDFYALGRYDVIAATFGTGVNSPLYLGLGASVLFRVN